jgi:hypothetical protein
MFDMTYQGQHKHSIPRPMFGDRKSLQWATSWLVGWLGKKIFITEQSHEPMKIAAYLSSIQVLQARGAGLKLLKCTKHHWVMFIALGLKFFPEHPVDVLCTSGLFFFSFLLMSANVSEIYYCACSTVG